MIKKTKAYFISFMGMICISLQALSLSVQTAEIIKRDGAFVLDLQFDGPFQPEPDREDGETILIEFPEDTEWKPPLNQNSNLGISYTYIPYQDGSGDLVIKKDARLTMGEIDQHNIDHYSIPFYARQTSMPQAPSEPVPPIPASQDSGAITEAPTPSGPLAITRLRVGKKNNGTRFVMDLSRQTKFVVKENSDFTKFYITPAESTKWIPALSSAQKFGLFQGYRIVNINGDVSVEVFVVPGTRVHKAQILGVKNGHPKLVIDLQPKGVATTATTSVASAIMPKHIDLNKAPHKIEVAPKNTPIKSFNILRQNDDTLIRIATNDVENFKVKENLVTDEVTILLPKIDWKDVEVLKEKGGLVDGFRINQDDKDHTKLILKVQKTTRVIGKKGFGRKGLARFVVYLNQGENKTPTWLVDASADDLSYDNFEKEEGEVSNVLYRGGIRGYTTVGTGFYIGAKASSVSGENKKHTDVASIYKTDIFQNNFGGAAHIFAGYGMNLGKLYGGVETDIGIYGVDAKTSFVNGTERTSSSDIKYIWGVSGRAGYYITPTSLLYARIGAVSGSFKYGGSEVANGQVIYPNNYEKRRRSGFLYGVGLESALNDMFTVRIEGAQLNFQTFRARQGNNSVKDRFLINQISMGGAYKFSPMAGPSVGGIFSESVGTGFYFGIAGGISTLTNHRKVHGTTSGGNATDYDGQGSALDPSWSIYAGWSDHMERFFYGGEFQLDLTKPIISESISHATGNETERYSNKLRWLWALTGRAGYIFNHGTVGYGRFGIVGAQLSHTGVHAGAERLFTVTGACNAYALGIRMGAGLETFITDRLSIRGDYVLDYMPGVKIKDKIDGTYNEKISLINNEFKLGLSWYLDP